MMGWFFSSLKSLRRPSRESRRAPKRNRSWNVEDLEGRRLLSQAFQAVATLPVNGLVTTNIVSGPGEDLWVAANSSGSSSTMERIGLNGSVRSFAVPGNLIVSALAAGPDGNVWFVGTSNLDNGNANSNVQLLVGEVTPNGQFTEHPPIRVATGQHGVADTTQFATAPDGDLWFGYSVLGNTPSSASVLTQNFLGRVTAAGTVTLFPVSSYSTDTGAMYALAAEPDGNLWFTEQISQEWVLGRMTPNGVVTQFPLGRNSANRWAEVADGSNGSLVLIDRNLLHLRKVDVIRVSTAGVMTPYKIPAAIAPAFADYLGTEDRSVWFSNILRGGTTIGRITPSGVAKSYSVSNAVHGPNCQLQSMVLGPDGKLYVLVQGTTNTWLYRLSPDELH
jgi:streptogramin lyase